MIIIKEKSRSQEAISSSSDSNWQKSSKVEMISTMKNFITRKMSLFVVGPDQYWIKNALLGRSSSGTLLLSDSNGLIVGFSESSISNRV